MEIEQMVANITAFGSSAGVESAVLMGYFGVLQQIWATFICGRVATLCAGVTFLRPKNLSSDHLMKLEWLIADIPAVGSSIRAENAIFWVNLVFFAYLGHFCGRGDS